MRIILEVSILGMFLFGCAQQEQQETTKLDKESAITSMKGAGCRWNRGERGFYILG